jgi:hypothetical protein
MIHLWIIALTRRQHGRSRPQPRGVLKWKRCLADARLRHLARRPGPAESPARRCSSPASDARARSPCAFRPHRSSFGLDEATKLIAGQIKAIKRFWKEICDTAALSEVDRNFLWRRQFLNPFAFADAPEALVELLE